ncbi:disease resistance protein RUN1-like isoform X2 [Ziziphus jujuba]|uniref:Disease resistance protein RUN1-like isoform X2 n=1 Tax=Ziziphus jujuba TaxID=326968 RepID=A0ABM4ACK0_ZIZJJ|nr:disease resistance protein RUN1-like isoform X2 [Ziziphus jujuba]
MLMLRLVIASMASSSLSFQEKYDVFLSFRGEDTRNTFASYLYAALSAKQILTFMDHELERGDEISPTLRRAIEESKISVIIFSENYASSTWCLDELVQILECKKTREQIVIPIFYGIDPSVVRKQKGSYGVSFAELEERFRDRMEKVHQWRAALTEASNLCGLDSKDFREPGKRSRLWDVKDVCHVLERNMGTQAVEGISFNMSEISKDIKICHASFSEMYNLRFLKIYCDNIDNKKFKLYLPQGLGSYLSDKLTYLQWDLYPLKSLPSKFSPENLVELILRGSHIEKLWNQHEVKSLPVLRMIDLSYSKFLTQLSDLSQAPNLESINLEGCTSLAQVFSSLQNLEKLTYLNLNGCIKLGDFQEISKRSEGYLDVVRLEGVKNVLNNFTFLKSCIQSFTGNLCLYSSQTHMSQKFAPNLTSLLMRETAIETVPPSIGYLSGLVKLDLVFCKRLKSLPTSICHLKSLEELDLTGCEKLKTFPEILEPMEHLTNLRLEESGIKELPESIENVVSLKVLHMQKCKDLEFLPYSLCNLRKLEAIRLSYCSTIQNLPSISHNYPPTIRAKTVKRVHVIREYFKLEGSTITRSGRYHWK